LAGLGGVLIDTRYAFAAAAIDRHCLAGGSGRPSAMTTVDATVEACVVHIVTADR
jgi:hypothetical protein